MRKGSPGTVLHDTEYRFLSRTLYRFLCSTVSCRSVLSHFTWKRPSRRVVENEHSIHLQGDAHTDARRRRRRRSSRRRRRRRRRRMRRRRRRRRTGRRGRRRRRRRFNV